MAVIFAAFHGTPLWAIAVLPLGLWLGVLAWRTGSLLPGMVCHGFINGGVNAFRVATKMGMFPEELPPAVHYVAWPILLGCLLLSIWLLAKTRPSLAIASYDDGTSTGSPIRSTSMPHNSPIDSTITSGR